MRTETFFKRDDGTNIRLDVSLNVSFDHFVWSHREYEKRKRCREFLAANKVVTEDEILSAKMKIWESIKPQP